MPIAKLRMGNRAPDALPPRRGAIRTENRRIKRVIVGRQQELETSLSLPKKTINIRDQIRSMYQKLKGMFMNRDEKLAFSELSGKSKEEKIAAFIPLLHLDNQQKVMLEQDGHFEEIHIWLKSLYEKHHADELAQMAKDVEEDDE